MNSSLGSLSPIAHVSISEKAYSALRESILRRTFAPGQQLHLEQLELQLGVSRTPLKQALTRLTLEGLVKITPRRGTYVAELNPEDVTERFDMRRFLEVGAVEQALQGMTPEGLHKMCEIAASLEKIVRPDGDTDQYEQYIDWDREFHATFIGFAHNKMLNEAYENLNVHLYVVRVYYAGRDKNLDRVNQEHRELLRVLETCDVAAVRRAISNHLEKSKQDILAKMHSKPSNWLS